MRCPYCGGEVPARIKPGGSPKKFCSPSHRVMFYRRKNREHFNEYMKIYRIKRYIARRIES